jgi:hypothetical protein
MKTKSMTKSVAHARLRNEPGVRIISRGPGAMNASIALHVAITMRNRWFMSGTA